MTRSLHILLLVLLAALPVRAADQRPPTSITLGQGLRAEVSAEGVVSLWQTSAGQERLLLRSHWPSAPPPRPGRVTPDFLGTAREGITGGRRGFTSAADDDGDGQVDEDRLDGVDNDGDGLIDEDFAAVGDAMVTWHRQRPTWSRHLEAYHWSYASLQSLLALTLQHDGGGLVDAFRLEVAAPASWRSLDPLCPETGDEAGGPTFLCEVPSADGHDVRWVGVVVLDAGVRTRPQERLRAEAGQLTMPLRESELTMVISVGVSRLQVADDLLTAASLQQGMSDPLTGASLSWLPRPDWDDDQQHGLVTVRDLGHARELHLAIAAAEVADLDPDRWFASDDDRLTVTELRWIPQAGEPSTLPWPARSLSSPLCLPHRWLGATGPGVLVASVARPSPIIGDHLTAHRTDGRPVIFDVAWDSSATVEDAVDADPFTVTRLSPTLLTNYPNPFRASTSISYRVPATVGEAFDLDAPDAPDLDPTRPMPYASSLPQVVVSIFSLEGSRIASLTTDRRGPGIHEVSWDGRDEQGRTVPSGAYFCKLEIENWSVTKRLIFIR
jgi:hypothetical protein